MESVQIIGAMVQRSLLLWYTTLEQDAFCEAVGQTAHINTMLTLYPYSTVS
jgi:hypothetical protein